MPRLVLEWAAEHPDELHRRIDGTLVYTDLSGFTAMSEKLGRLGRLGAEELTVHLDGVFGALLEVATSRGGDLLKFGGDALLLFFWDEAHAPRAVAAAHEMREVLRTVGRITTEAGRFRLRMSVGIHSGAFDFFLAGGSHRELVITGREATVTNEMEETAEAGEILLSQATAAKLRPAEVGIPKGTGLLLARKPRAPDRGTQALPPASVDPTEFVPVALRARLADAERYGEHRPATISFLHFVGVDTMLHSAGPAATAVSVDRFIQAVQEAFDEHGVTFLTTDIYDDGGKVFAQAGAPVSHENDEDRMLRALRQLLDSDLPFALRIGVNRGTVFAGEIGTTSARTYTAMGDAVNTAARVMGKAAPGQMLATLPVIRRSRTQFITEPIEPFSVKGKTEPLSAVSVGPISRSEVGAGRTGAAPLVGRERELAKLLGAADAATSGMGQLVRIVAEPGMGKTRLVDELLARRPLTTAIRVQCDDYSKATPFGVAEVLLGHALGLTAADRGTRGEQLLEIVENSAPELLPWAPLLARAVGADLASTTETDALDPQFAPQRLRAVVTELLQETIREAQLWVVEDAHWADPTSLELFDAVAAAIAKMPLLLVFTMRPPAAERPDAETIELTAIGERDVRALMASAMGRAILPHEAEELLARYGGNPLYILEVVRSGRADDPPEALEGAVNARLDALPASARRALRDLSVLGGRASADLARMLVPSLDQELVDLGEVLGSEGDTIFFRHNLFREIAYGGLPFRRRRVLHQRAGRFIEENSDAETNASALSLHFHLGRDYDSAWRWSVVAARKAVESYAFPIAAELYARAIEAVRQLPQVSASERLDVVRGHGEALRRSGQLAAATVAYRQARRLTPGAHARAELLVLQGGTVFMQGKPAAALRLLRQAKAILAGDGSLEAVRIIGRANRSQASILSNSFGRYDRSLPLARQAVQLAIQCDDAVGAALAQLEVLTAAARLGEPCAAEEAALGLKLAERTADRRLMATVLGQLGVGAHVRGDWSEALSLLHRCHEQALAAGFTLACANASKNLGEILSNQGRYPEAASHLEEAVDTARAAGSWQAVEYEAHLGRLRVRAGDLDEGRRLLDSVVEEARRLHLPAVESEALAFVAEHELAADRPAAALKIADQLVARRDLDRRARLLRIRAEALAEVRPAESAAAARQAAQTAEEEHDLYERALALRLIDELDAAAEAAALFDQLGVVRAPACTPAPA